MTGSLVSEIDDETALKAARAKLEAFENGASAKDLIARLRHATPMHPVLLVRGLALFGAAVSGLATVGVLAAPLLSRDVAVFLLRLDEASGVPLPALLAVLGFCGLAVAIAAHLAAISLGRSAPFLPHEAKAHQRLVSEVKQLEAQRAVKERMTPPPARPRLLAR